MYGLLEQQKLRQALGRYATGVAMITVQEAGHTLGLTVNSFTSVSLDPPLVSWCIRKSSGRVAPFVRPGLHTISILSRQHEAECRRIAAEGMHRLTGIPLDDMESGPPAITGALAVFECRQSRLYDTGDHFLVLGEVLRAGAGPERSAPLIFFNGKFTEIPAARAQE